MVRPIAFSVVLLITLIQVVALINKSDVKYDSALQDACLEFNGRCCPNSACSIKYSLSGRWETQTAQKCPGPCTRCKKICDLHTQECRRKCGQLFRVVTQRSSNDCQCVRDFSGTEDLRVQCITECLKGRGRCISGCDRSTCPLVAKLVMKFDVVVPGKCKATCPKKVLRAPAACRSNQRAGEPSTEAS